MAKWHATSGWCRNSGSGTALLGACINSASGSTTYKCKVKLETKDRTSIVDNKKGVPYFHNEGVENDVINVDSGKLLS
ncbi:MAG TPA: hypothetical protein VK658_08985 [Chryseolinea sp.]|nr:hypothetical protein [Chryseolinea sp.]